jgi:hypothetical protein
MKRFRLFGITQIHCTMDVKNWAWKCTKVNQNCDKYKVYFFEFGPFMFTVVSDKRK